MENLIKPQVPSNLESYNAFTHPAKSLSDLIGKFQDLENLDNEDTVIDLNALRMADNGNIIIPSQGEYAMTEHARKQVSSLVGVSWNRWFMEIDPIEKAQEINRRFSRSNAAVRLRTRRMVQPTADGVLRAFVSPNYTIVKDSQLAWTIYSALHHLDQDLHIIRSDITDRTVTYVIGVGKPFVPNGDSQINDVWGGILVRNSDVGYASLKITLYLTRLVCRNGMTAPLKNAELLRRKHTKGILDANLLNLLAEQLINVPDQLRHGGQLLQTALSFTVTDIEAEVTRILDASNLPKRLMNSIMSSYQIEPRANKFGVSSALTRAAQGFSPEERLQIEDAASQYLQS